MRIVIDTNIIVKAIKEYLPSHIMVVYLVKLKGHKLVFDFEGKLQQEYADNVGKETMYQKWLHELQKSNQLEWASGDLPHRHRKRLLSLGFHEEEDRLIVALAWNTDRYIITEDSDFGKGNPERAQLHIEVLDYLTNTMGIDVRAAEESLSDSKFSA